MQLHAMVSFVRNRGEIFCAVKRSKVDIFGDSPFISMIKFSVNEVTSSQEFEVNAFVSDRSSSLTLTSIIK